MNDEEVLKILTAIRAALEVQNKLLHVTADAVGQLQKRVMELEQVSHYHTHTGPTH